MNNNITLTVVIPVYNEQEIIQDVIKSWSSTLRELKINYEIRAFNDGSTDNSLQKLNEMERQNPELRVIHKPNSGHGPTIIEGYRSVNSKWVLQIDSDDEMKPQYFKKLWQNRDKYDLLLGKRENRKLPITRNIVTWMSRITVKIFYGSGVNDVNSPYRLYRTEKFRDIFDSIPSNTFAPNVILSGYAVKNKLRIIEFLVPWQQRITGEVSIKRLKLLKVAFISWLQTIKYSFSKEISSPNVTEMELIPYIEHQVDSPVSS